MNWYKLSRLNDTNTYTIGPYSNLILLGCGEAGGCAYLDPLTGHAIKQTKSESEAHRALNLLNKDYAFFPKIFKVIPYENTWLIEREEIPSLPESDQEILDIAQEALEEVNYDLDLFPEQLRETLFNWGMDSDENYARAFDMSKKLLNLMDSVKDIGDLPGEIRGENIGIRDGQFIVRDVDV